MNWISMVTLIETHPVRFIILGASMMLTAYLYLLLIVSQEVESVSKGHSA